MFTIKSLGSELDAWVHEQVSSGRFDNEADVFFEAMRLFRETMDDPEVGRAVLKAQLAAGMRSGPGRPAHEVFDEFRNRLKSKTAA